MIRIAKESDLPAVAAVYEAILDHEDATGLHYTGWKRGAYPTAETARSIFNAGTLYVGVDEDGAIWGSMNLNGVQLPEYKNGGWSIPAEDDQVAVIHTLTIHPDRAGQGLARQMVAFAEDTARSQGKTVRHWREQRRFQPPLPRHRLPLRRDGGHLLHGLRPLPPESLRKKAVKPLCKPTVYKFRREVGGDFARFRRYCSHERM